MIIINKPMPEKLPNKTIIKLSEDYKNIIVLAPAFLPSEKEKAIKQLQNDVEQFIKIELEKAKKQQEKYNTIINTLTEAMGG